MKEISGTRKELIMAINECGVVNPGYDDWEQEEARLSRLTEAVRKSTASEDSRESTTTEEKKPRHSQRKKSR